MGQPEEHPGLVLTLDWVGRVRVQAGALTEVAATGSRALQRNPPKWLRSHGCPGPLDYVVSLTVT